MRLYKYISKQFADAFARRGAIKIGTLYEYRNTEKYNSAVADKDEGSFQTEFELLGGGEVDLGGTTPEADFFRKHVLRPGQQASNVKIVMEDGARIISRSNSEDLYVLCCSTHFSRDVMVEFGCNACVEISDAQAFVNAVSHTIRHQARLVGFGQVHYLEKTKPYTEPHQLHPAVMKDPKYAYQCEWRSLWAPIKPIKGPLFIHASKAASYCSWYAP